MEEEGRRFRAAAAPIDLRTNDTMERYSVARLPAPLIRDPLFVFIDYAITAAS